MQSEISEQQQQENKYTVKPPRELKSRFVIEQEKKKQEAEAELLKQKQEEVTGGFHSHTHRHVIFIYSGHFMAVKIKLGLYLCFINEKMNSQSSSFPS